MYRIKRMLTNICSENLAASKTFYTKLFDFRVDYNSDWFIHLISHDKQLELGIIDTTSDIVPNEVKNTPQGFYLTFVVENVDKVFETAKNAGFEIRSEPSDTFYGQRRLLLQDPNGTIVDVSSPIQNRE